MSGFKDLTGVRLSAPMTSPLIATLPTDARLTRELLEQAATTQSAKGFVRRIHARMVEFAKGLDSTQEVGVAMVRVVMGIRVQLIQHLHQINFLLMTVPAKNPDAPKRQIGLFSAE